MLRCQNHRNTKNTLSKTPHSLWLFHSNHVTLKSNWQRNVLLWQYRSKTNVFAFGTKNKHFVCNCLQKKTLFHSPLTRLLEYKPSVTWSVMPSALFRVPRPCFFSLKARRNLVDPRKSRVKPKEPLSKELLMARSWWGPMSPVSCAS